MERPVKVACVQVEPVVLDREATLDKLETVAARGCAARRRARRLPRDVRARLSVVALGEGVRRLGGAGAKETFARLAQESVAVGSPAERRIGAAAQELGIWS